VDDAGNALAFWRYYTRRDFVLGDVFNLMARHFTAASNTWEASTQLATAVDESADSIDAVMVETDHALVTWEVWDGDQSANSRSQTLARTYRNGTWETTTDLGVGYFPRLTTGGGKAVLANSIVAPAGNLVAAAREYRPVSGWGTPSNLDDPTVMSGLVLLDANAAGQTMALWTRINGVTSAAEGLYVNYHDGTNWQDAARTLAGSTNGDVPLDIKLDGNGNAIAIWQRGTALWVNRFAVP